MNTKPKIALISSPRLGDSVNFLIFAHNLDINGFGVTLFSNILSSMSEWLPNIIIKNLPVREKLVDETRQFDLVIADQRGIFEHRKNQNLEEIKLFSENFIFYNILGDLEQRLFANQTEKFKKKLNVEVFKKCESLVKGFKDFRSCLDSARMTIPAITYELCKDFLKLANVEKSTGLKPPDSLGLIKCKYLRRILIHPYTPDERKNWSLKKYYKLARNLIGKQYEVAFMCAPQERDRLIKEGGSEFQVPIFKDISDLAAYIYESRLLIGNDSGTGHLASALGLPTVTVTNKGKNFIWRPDFAENVIVSSVSIKLGGNRIWKPFISVNKVYKTFQDMTDKAKELERTEFSELYIMK